MLTPPRTPFGRLSLALAFSFALGGAFGRTDAAPNAYDPCASASDAMVTRALGSPMTSAVRNGQPPAIGAPAPSDMRICRFHPAGGRSLRTAGVSAARFATVRAARARFRSFTGDDSSQTGAHADRLYDIADEAVVAQPFLYARKGRAVFVFFISDDASPPRNQLELERLARAVMPGVKP